MSAPDWSQVTATINGVPLPGVASFSMVRPTAPAPARLSLACKGGFEMSATLHFMADGLDRLQASIRRAEREATKRGRERRRIGRGARLATRRRQRGEARRLATSFVRDIQRRGSPSCAGYPRVARPSGWAHNMARAATIAKLLAATWNHVPRPGRL